MQRCPLCATSLFILRPMKYSRGRGDHWKGMVRKSGVCTKVVVVDARHHMLGCLTSILVKELLNGQRIVVVHCEEIYLFGRLVHQKIRLEGRYYGCHRLKEDSINGIERRCNQHNIHSRIFYKVLVRMTYCLGHCKHWVISISVCKHYINSEGLIYHLKMDMEKDTI